MSKNDDILESLVFEAAGNPILICDFENKIVAANTAFVNITGYAISDVIGHVPIFLDSGYQHDELRIVLEKSLPAVGKWNGEMWLRRKNGEVFPAWITATSATQSGNLNHNVLLFSDMSGHKLDDQQTRYRANFDALTDLPNKQLFCDRLGNALRRADRDKTKISVLHMSLGQFKKVNDTYGHDAGDDLLKQVADRLNECVGNGDSVARFAGDHFAVLMEDLNDLVRVEDVAEHITHALEKHYIIGMNEVFVTPSIGISVYPDDGTHGEALLSQADKAMYLVKESGKAGFRFFTPEIDEAMKNRNALESALRHAIRYEEFFLHYQPIYNVADQEMIGLEALVRWYDPDKGMIMPDDFIPLAEETGLIVLLGEWVLRQACHDIAHLRSVTGKNLHVAVNVAAPQFYQRDFDKQILSLLGEFDLPADALELEVTERLLLDERSEPAEIMRVLSQHGVRLSIDDFGTGYSALSYLKRFPFNTLKIDRAFISDVMTNQEDAALVNAIIAMAHSLGLKVVAEGVENEAQLQYLHDRGADMAQGFHLKRPVLIRRIEASLDEK